MKKSLEKISLLLAVTLMLSVFSGCGAKPLEITEEEAFAVLSDLVPKSYEINVIIFGSGIPAVPEAYVGEHTQTAYYPVADDSPYKSVADIKKAAEKIYSKRYLEGVYICAFEGVTPDGSEDELEITVSPRYTDISGKLNTDVTNEGVVIKNRLNVISSEIVKKTSKYVKLRAVCTEEGKDGEFETHLLITLENDVWLLDSPTY